MITPQLGYHTNHFLSAKINMSKIGYSASLKQMADELKSYPAFHNFIAALEAELETLRVQYEVTGPASEYLRGRVVELRHLIETLKRG